MRDLKEIVQANQEAFLKHKEEEKEKSRLETIERARKLTNRIAKINYDIERMSVISKNR